MTDYEIDNLFLKKEQPDTFNLELGMKLNTENPGVIQLAKDIIGNDGGLTKFKAQGSVLNKENDTKKSVKKYLKGGKLND